MTSGYFSIVIKDIGLNPSNYTYPVLPTLQDLYTTIDRRFYKNYILNFGLTEVHTDNGLIDEQINIDKYIQFRKAYENFVFREEEEYLAGNEIILIQIRLDDNILVQKRSYTKISEIFSRIGGYMQLMNTVFILLSLLINKTDAEIKILNSIFNYNLKENKITLKYPTLNSLYNIKNNNSLKNLDLSLKSQTKEINSKIIDINKSNSNLILNININKNKGNILKNNNRNIEIIENDNSNIFK